MDCIMLAAGKGERAKLGYPKQFARLDGKPIFIHTLEIFESMPEIDRILLAVIPGMENNFKELIAQYGINKVEIVHGGKTRQESVYNCLQRVTSERVIIHEAVRPFVTQEFIKTLMEKELIAAVVPIVPIKETTVSFDTVGAGKYPPDSCLVQLPQVFLTEPLKTAHKTAAAVKQRCTDDSSLLYSYLNDYNAIRYTHGLEQNIKITTPLDLLYAEVLHREGYCGCHRSK